MKVFLCLALFAAAAFAEPPSYRQNQQQRYFFARQQEETTADSGPYAPSGWRPEGPAFNLPQRNQKQEQQPQVSNAYGPPQEPQQQYGPPQEPQQQYGPPQQPSEGQGPSPRQRTPSTQQPQRFAKQQQQQQFRGQFARQQQQQPPQQQYGAPNPQTQYGAPNPQTEYGAPNQQTPDYTTTEAAVIEIDEPVTVGELEGSESEQTGGSNELEGEDGDIEAGQPRDSENQQRGEYYVALPNGRLQRVRYVSRQDLEAMRYFAKIRAENVEPLRGPIYAYSPLQKLQVAPGQLQVAVAPAAVVPAAPATLTVTASEAKPQKLVQRQPKVDIKPLAQVQIQHDNPAQVVPLSSSYTTYTANYQVPAAPTEDRFILAFP